MFSNRRSKFLSLGFILLLAFILIACDNKEKPKVPVEPEIKNVFIYFETGFDDVEVNTLEGKPGATLVKPEDPIKKGYVFSHWTLAGHDYNFQVFPSSSIVLEAVWDEAYQIIYDTDSDYDFPTATYLEGENIELPTLEFKIDSLGNAYQFLGWYYNDSLFSFSAMPNKDLVLVAKWQKENAIIFDTGNSDTIIAPIFADSGKTIVAPQIEPKLDGYIFSGWDWNNKTFVFDKMPSGTITVNANYVRENDEYNKFSNLPKMFINLENNFHLNEVDRKDYKKASITITNTTDEQLMTAVSTEFRGRGHGSWTDSGPKRGYRLKLFKKQEVLGVASNRHWALLAGANFNDTTLAKNATAFNLANEVLSAIEYASETNWVELYINNEFRGVYILTEHTRVGKDRVNIDPEFGVLDTGYLIEYDAYAPEDGPEGIAYFNIPGVKYPFAIKGPDPDDYLEEGITEEEFRKQISYIRDYTALVYNAALTRDLDTFKKYADINSFIDMYILHELFKNTDTGWSSFYMMKKPGGKLYATAPWDFDASAGSNRGDRTSTGLYVASADAMSSSAHTASELYIELYKSSEWRSLVRDRWLEISMEVKMSINNFLSDEFIETNKFAFARNYKRWDGEYSPRFNTQEEANNWWVNNVKTLRNWLLTRAEWFDDNIGK